MKALTGGYSTENVEKLLKQNPKLVVKRTPNTIVAHKDGVKVLSALRATCSVWCVRVKPNTFAGCTYWQHYSV
jgi:hypothetical protein